MHRYWSIYLPTMAALFLGPEFWALGHGRPQDTLSEYIWHFEKLQPGQSVWQWSAVHFLLTGILGTFALWAFVHLAFGRLR